MRTIHDEQKINNLNKDKIWQGHAEPYGNPGQKGKWVPLSVYLSIYTSSI